MRVARFSLLLALTGCIPITTDGTGKDSASGDDTAVPEGFSLQETSTTSKRDGTFDVEVTIDDPQSVFQVVMESTNGRYTVATEFVYNPAGNAALDWNDWYASEESLTEAFVPGDYSAINWPIRREDGPLTAGTWTVSGAVIDSSGYYASGIDVDLHVMRRPDPDFAAGQLNVVFAYAGGLETDAEVVRGMEAGVAYWKEIYGAYGVAVTVTYTTVDIDAALPDTYRGVDEYEPLMEAWPDRAVLMVVGDTIGGASDVYGEAGFIGGPYYPGPASAVEISWLTHAGTNGRFSDPEIQILGETMAHEMGHYLGLFHPVEYGWNYWDALDDTDHCSSMNVCENDMGTNLMFPYPICYGASCPGQNLLTADQTGVTHRYVGVE